MLEELVYESQSQISFFVGGIEFNTGFCVILSQAIVFVLNLREGSILSSLRMSSMLAAVGLTK